MMRYVKYRMELHQLRRVQKRLDQEFESEYKEAVKRGHDDGELSSIGQKLEELDQWIQFHQTRYLESVCQGLIIPLPEKTDPNSYSTFNFDDDEGDRFILTIAAMHALRSKIREERKATREVVGFWMAMTTGIIGSLIGLLTIIKK